MGKPFARLTYKDPEQFQPDEIIPKGEAISMITDLLRAGGDRNQLRRRVKGKVEYALQTGKLNVSKHGGLVFNALARWANQNFANENSAIRRMHYRALVQTEGLCGVGTVGSVRIHEMNKEYIRALQDEIDENNSVIAALRTQAKADSPFIETGRKVREGARLGGNTRKIMRPRG